MENSKLYEEMTEKSIEIADRFIKETGKNLDRSKESMDVLSLVAGMGYAEFKNWFHPILLGRRDEVCKLPTTKLVQITFEMFSPYELQEYISAVCPKKAKEIFAFYTRNI